MMSPTAINITSLPANLLSFLSSGEAAFLDEIRNFCFYCLVVTIHGRRGPAAGSDVEVP
jgi:hypothetical protein